MPVEVLEKVTYKGAQPLSLLIVKLAANCPKAIVMFPTKKHKNSTVMYVLLSEDRESLRKKRYEKYMGHGVFMYRNVK